VKKKFVTARFSESEYLVLSMIAAHEGLNLSESMRWLVRQESARRGMPSGLVRLYAKLPEIPIPEVLNGQPR
jgi:hypothetical protein